MHVPMQTAEYKKTAMAQVCSSSNSKSGSRGLACDASGTCKNIKNRVFVLERPMERVNVNVCVCRRNQQRERENMNVCVRL